MFSFSVSWLFWNSKYCKNKHYPRQVNLKRIKKHHWTMLTHCFLINTWIKVDINQNNALDNRVQMFYTDKSFLKYLSRQLDLLSQKKYWRRKKYKTLSKSWTYMYHAKCWLKLDYCFGVNIEGNIIQTEKKTEKEVNRNSPLNNHCIINLEITSCFFPKSGHRLELMKELQCRCDNCGILVQRQTSLRKCQNRNIILKTISEKKAKNTIYWFF